MAHKKTEAEDEAMMAAASGSTCNVCAQPFTAKARPRQVLCVCGHAACAGCLRQWARQQGRAGVPPSCMACKAPIAESRLAALGSGFLQKFNGDRAAAVLRQERVRLPGTQAIVTARATARELDTRIRDKKRRRKELTAEIDEMQARAQAAKRASVFDPLLDASRADAVACACPDPSCRWSVMRDTMACGVCGERAC